MTKPNMTQPAGAQSPSATPRVDAVEFGADVGVNRTAYCVHADFARTLERELSAAHAALAEAQRHNVHLKELHALGWARHECPLCGGVSAMSSTGEGSGV